MNPPRKLHIKSYGCQMNVYDAQRMVDTLAPEGFVETRKRRRRGSGDPQHLPHPRKGLRESLFGTRAAARRQGRSRAQRPQHEHRGGRLRRAGRRPGDHPPRAGGRCRGRPAKLSSSAAIAGAREKPRPRAGDRISGRGQVRISGPAEAGRDPRARHFVLRHGAGRLRQILHLLRRALYARRRSVAAGGEDRRRCAPARRQWRARNHADRAERQRLSRRRTGRTRLAARNPAAASCGNSRHRPAALLDQPSPRRRRDADRGASRSCRR